MRPRLGYIAGCLLEAGDLLSPLRWVDPDALGDAESVKPNTRILPTVPRTKPKARAIDRLLRPASKWARRICNEVPRYGSSRPPCSNISGKNWTTLMPPAPPIWRRFHGRIFAPPSPQVYRSGERFREVRWQRKRNLKPGCAVSAMLRKRTLLDGYREWTERWIIQHAIHTRPCQIYTF